MSEQVDQKNLTEQATLLVEAARRAGADMADAVCVRGQSLSVEVRLGKIEESRRAEGDDFTLRAFVGHRSAAVSANVLTEPSELAERAVAMARQAPEDPYAGLADADRLARTLPDLDLLDPAAPSAEDLTDTALQAEETARAVKGVTNSGGASASWRIGGLVLATSHGFCGAYSTSRFSVSASAIAGTGTEMERDYEFETRTHLADLPAAAEVGRKAGERAVRRLGPRQMTTGRAAVVFDPRVAGGLIGHLAGAANGAAIVRRTSFLREKLSTQVFAENIRISDDPLRKRGLASRPFDGEGVAVEPLELVVDGVLQSWILDSASARELGLATNGRATRAGSATSPAATNLALATGRLSPEALIADTGKGLYVTELIGQGVNLVTGDYSRGAAGYAIEDGALTYPVSEITIAGNLLDMFAHMQPANDLAYRFAVNAPTVAVEGMTIAGR